MRILIALPLMVFMTMSGFAQNLVLNPGFDSYITCPGFGQFSSTYINNWNKPSIASSDYYHYNCAGIQPSVQAPLSGEGYAGIIAYNFGTEYREYITGTFASPLVAGQTYNVEFFASLNDGYIQAIVELGAYISVLAPGPFPNAIHINVVPQIENLTGPVQDTAGWKKISGQFVALGGEQFITIGNFNDDNNTTISQPGSTGSFGAYYFIEDVSVTLDSTTSVLEIENSPQLKVWHSQEFIHVRVSNVSEDLFPLQLQAFNSIGQKILDHRLVLPNETDIPFLNESGVYLFSVSGAGKNLGTAKVIIKR